MIILPRYRGMPDPQRPIHAGKFRFSGEARVVLYDENLNMQYDSGFFPNLIVDNGLNILGAGPNPLHHRTYIGTGSSPTTVGMTAMEIFLAESSTPGAAGTADLGTAPDYEYFEDKSHRFAAGVGTGTISEIGMGQSDDNTGTDIFNRVVLGVPVVKAANQVLDVFFRLTVWPPVIDVLGVSTIEGVTYDTITRGRDYPAWNGSGSPAYDFVAFNGSVFGYTAWPGDIGIITSNPGGGQDDLSGGSLDSPTYVPGTFSRTVTAFAGLDSWNVTAGLIRSLGTDIKQFKWQTQFNAVVGGTAIPKAITEIMDFSWSVTWDRDPP